MYIQFWISSNITKILHIYLDNIIIMVVISFYLHNIVSKRIPLQPAEYHFSFIIIKITKEG